jgi:hypothetical protein
VPARRYTEEQFRAAVADPEVRTLADLCRALGIVPRGANYETVRAYGRALHIDVDHELAWRRLDRSDADLRAAAGQAESISAILRTLELAEGTTNRHALIRERLRRLGLRPPGGSRTPQGGDPARRSYTDDQLRTALSDPSVDSYLALCEKLELRPNSNTYRRLHAHAHQLGVEVPAAWSRPGPRRPRATRMPPLHPEPVLRDAVNASLSLAATLRRLGERPTAAAYARIRHSLSVHGIDTSHFRGDGGTSLKRRRPLEEILVDGRLVNSTRLRARLVEEGIKPPECEDCRRSTWRGRPVPLELDHVDGDRTNNRLENLRLLCPNCHALTPTYRGRNIGRGSTPPPI